jgi:hypothetical protein
VVSSIGRISKKLRECQQTARLPRLLLSVDLLKAQNIGIEPQELRPHEGDAVIECRLLPWLVVEVL